MEIILPWGKEKITVQVPDTWRVSYPAAAGVLKKITADGVKTVQAALKKPIDSPPIEKLKLKGKKIVIVVDDNTRPTPAHLFFHLVLSSLVKAGADLKKVLLVPALGTHTPMTAVEMAEKVGAKNLSKIKWENHDAFNKDRNHYFGKTRRGTPVWLNKRIAEADLIISIGLVEPHLWAGFGGGLKNLLPGLAHEETMGIHHTIITEPPYLFNRVGMMPDKNSFRQDLEEIKEMISAPIFCLNVVLDAAGMIIAAFAGDPITVHREGVAFNIQTSGRILDSRVDGVIANSYPMDLNMKQSIKCVGNALPALKPGGIIMGFLKADRGIDDLKIPDDAKPLWLVKTILRTIGPSRVMGFLERVRKGLDVERKFQIYYSMQLMRQYDLFLYLPSISDDEVKRMGFFVRCVSPQEVIDRAVKKLGKNARVAVFPEGGVTFPIIKG